MKNLNKNSFKKIVDSTYDNFKCGPIKEDFMNYPYPLTIISDRYSGAYSGSMFLAFPYLYHEIGIDIDGGDVECMEFWDSYKGYNKFLCGYGVTMNDALEDLKKKVSNIKEIEYKYELA